MTPQDKIPTLNLIRFDDEKFTNIRTNLLETYGQTFHFGDYLLIRNAMNPTNQYMDTLFVPRLGYYEPENLDEGIPDYYYAVPCASYRSKNECIIPGVYNYRLGKTLGAIFGHLMEPARYYVGVNNLHSGVYDRKYKGFHIIFNRLHKIFSPFSPITVPTKGAINVSSHIYPQIMVNYESSSSAFNLFITHSINL